MKILKYILISVFFLSSCSNWLDISPEDEVVEEKLFKEASGYRNALNGIYKQIAEPSLYGKEATWGFMDVLAQTYNTGWGGIQTYDSYYKALTYDYELDAVKPYIESMWENAYNSIANCNNIIKNISKVDKSKFPQGQLEIDLIKGESLGLRAFLHFDMLRMFAPAPINDDGKSYIPYYKNYPSLGNENLIAKEVMSNVVADLVEAQTLVVQFDTMDILHKQWLSERCRFYASSSSSIKTAEDVFFAFRGFRMNYMAITAILARAYNYMGEYEKSKIEAEKIINLQDDKGGLGSLVYFTPAEKLNKSKKMTCDLIFSLSYPKLVDAFNPYCDDIDTELTINNFRNLFDDAADYRKKSLTYTTNTWNYYSSKYKNNNLGNVEESILDMIPMIRLSEMYYIIAEYYANNGNFTKATEYLDDVREGRNCTKGALNITDMDSFKMELLKEVRREFLGEGQVFFYYKKFNEKLSRKMKDEAFVFPLPKSEKI